MIPSRKQWKDWSLPSKYTTAGLVIGIASLLIPVVSWVSGGNDLGRMTDVRGEVAKAFDEIRKADGKKDQYVERYLKKRLADIERVEIIQIGGKPAARIYYYSYWENLTSHFRASVEIRHIADLNREYDEEEGWVPAALTEHIDRYEHAVYIGESEFLEIQGLARGDVYEVRMVDFNYDSDEPPTYPHRFQVL